MRRISIYFYWTFAVRHNEGAYHRKKYFVIMKRSLSWFGFNRNFAVRNNFITSPCLLHVFCCQTLIADTIFSIINLYLEFCRRLSRVISDHSTWERNSKKNIEEIIANGVMLFFFSHAIVPRSEFYRVESTDRLRWSNVSMTALGTASQQGDELKITKFIINNQQEYLGNVTHLLCTITVAN